MSQSESERFWNNARRGTPDQCWEWTGPRASHGYGYFYHDRLHRTRAHRLAWDLTNGPIPQGLMVLHRCDNRLCVNPSHLFLGTHADNMADKVAKGRGASGERHGRAKLTQAQVDAIRNDARSQRKIAASYGVSPMAISNIKLGKNWVGAP